MLGNLILGCLAMVGCLSIQCVVISILLGYFLRLQRENKIKSTMFNFSWLLIIAMLTQVIGTFFQIGIWAWLFYWQGEFELFENAFYHSMVNFTSLGYGDIVMSQERRLLGALEATNGVLMLGISTAFLYSIMNALIDHMGIAENTDKH